MARCSALLLVLLATSLLASTAQAYKRGDGTAYSDAYEKNKTGKNSCGFGSLGDKWEQYYAAIPSHMFDRDRDCGKCIRLRGVEDGASGDWVVVKVVDECASCEGDWDIDLSKPALKESTGYSWDRKTIEWEWTSCSGGRRMRLM